MRRLSVVFCGILLTLQLSAQSWFAGRVIDAGDSSPVIGATVDIENAGTTFTDQKGAFNIRTRSQTIRIKISSIGFKTLESNAQIGNEATVFTLERYNLFLQPVEITAIRAGDQAPFTKTNLSRKDIEKNNLGQDLPFLLNQTPSVVINSDAGNGVGYTGIRIRGSDPTRINVTLNGIPYNDAESQGTFFVDLPDFASSVNSIQIQRGVGTSSNGAGAFGATINISTNEFRENPYAEFNNSYGSFNTRKHTLKAGTGLLKDHFTVETRLSNISSDGYIDRASSDLQSFYFSAAYLNKKSSLRLNIFSGKEKTYQAWNGILQHDLQKSRTYNSAGTEKPGTPYENETDNYQQDHYQLFFNHRFSDRLSFNSAVFLTRGKGYYEQYKADESYEDYGLKPVITAGDTIFNTDLVRQLWLDNYFYGNTFSFQYKQKNSRFTLGGGVNRFDGKHYGKVIWAASNVPKDHQWYHLDATKSDVNLYTKFQQTISAGLEGYVDLQYRGVNYNINGFRDNPSLMINNRYRFFNPKLGISYSSDGYTGYLSWSVGNKEPNRDDFEAGNYPPKHETLHDFEMGIEKRTNRYFWGATLYYMLYNNQLVLTGKINDVGAYTRTNIPRSYRTGVELQGSVKMVEWLYAGGNLTLSSNKLTSFSEYVDDFDNGDQKMFSYTRKDISFSPAIIAATTVTLIPIKYSEILLSGKYVGRQFLDNTGNRTRSLADFYVQDIRLIYSLKKSALPESSLIFQFNNIFNRRYEPNGYTYNYISGGALQTENYVYPMAGFNWMVGVNIKL